MGQALLRATGRVRPRAREPPVKTHERPPDAASAPPAVSKGGGQDRIGISDSEVSVRNKDESALLEERSPQYDDMLRHMVGRISSRPGGKQEMGKAFIVEKYNRPMPKLRSSKAEAGTSEQRPLPPGTLNAAQVHQIILLHQGKSDIYQGPMDIQDIAKKFGVDSAQVEQIVQFMSLPPEDTNDKKGNS